MQPERTPPIPTGYPPVRPAPHVAPPRPMMQGPVAKWLVYVAMMVGVSGGSTGVINVLAIRDTANAAAQNVEFLREDVKGLRAEVKELRAIIVKQTEKIGELVGELRGRHAD